MTIRQWPSNVFPLCSSVDVRMSGRTERKKELTACFSWICYKELISLKFVKKNALRNLNPSSHIPSEPSRRPLYSFYLSLFQNRVSGCRACNGWKQRARQGQGGTAYIICGLWESRRCVPISWLLKLSREASTSDCGEAARHQSDVALTFKEPTRTIEVQTTLAWPAKMRRNVSNARALNIQADIVAECQVENNFILDNIL